MRWPICRLGVKVQEYAAGFAKAITIEFWPRWTCLLTSIQYMRCWLSTCATDTELTLRITTHAKGNKISATVSIPSHWIQVALPSKS